jgi:hypothetical protein
MKTKHEAIKIYPVPPKQKSVALPRGSQILHLFTSNSGELMAVVREPNCSAGANCPVQLPVEPPRHLWKPCVLKDHQRVQTFPLVIGAQSVRAPGHADITNLTESALTLAWNAGSANISRVFWLLESGQEVPQELYEQLDYLGVCNKPNGEILMLSERVQKGSSGLDKIAEYRDKRVILID